VYKKPNIVEDGEADLAQELRVRHSLLTSNSTGTKEPKHHGAEQREEPKQPPEAREWIYATLLRDVWGMPGSPIYRACVDHFNRVFYSGAWEDTVAAYSSYMLYIKSIRNDVLQKPMVMERMLDPCCQPVWKFHYKFAMRDAVLTAWARLRWYAGHFAQTEGQHFHRDEIALAPTAMVVTDVVEM